MCTLECIYACLSISANPLPISYDQARCAAFTFLNINFRFWNAKQTNDDLIHN